MKGSCACGALGYEIDSIDMPISHCHCSTCRKTHAAAYVSTAGVLRAHFRWTRGLEALRASSHHPGRNDTSVATADRTLPLSVSAQPR